MAKSRNPGAHKPTNAARPGRNAARPEKSAFRQAVDAAVHCVEKAILTEALYRHQGNRRAVCREWGIPYRTVLYKIAEYEINIPNPYSSVERKITHRQPKIDVSLLLPSPTERAMLMDDLRRGTMDINVLADDYGLSPAAIRAIIEDENNDPSSSTGEGDDR